MTFCLDRKHDGPCYWLAKDAPNGHVILMDGCHSEPAGVAQAAKLHHRIFGAEDDFYVVKIEPLPPWGDAPINDEAAKVCADMIASTGKQG